MASRERSWLGEEEMELRAIHWISNWLGRRGCPPGYLRTDMTPANLQDYPGVLACLVEEALTRKHWADRSELENAIIQAGSWLIIANIVFDCDWDPEA